MQIFRIEDVWRTAALFLYDQRTKEENELTYYQNDSNINATRRYYQKDNKYK